MNNFEEDFLALKQENDKLREQLKDKEQILKGAIFLIINDIGLNFEDTSAEDKKLIELAMRMQKIEIIFEYSKIDSGNEKEMIEFCNEFISNFMKE
jgi:hypothetical protein